jgi:hypothetical protein
MYCPSLLFSNKQMNLSDANIPSPQPPVMALMQDLMQQYWRPMWELVEENPEIMGSMTALLLIPERVILYLGRTHLGIEYVGPIQKDQLTPEGQLEVQYFDYTGKENLLDAILGFEFDATHEARLPLSGHNEKLYIPTNAAFDILYKNGWTFSAQSMIMGFNPAGFVLEPDQFTRLTHSFFYGTDEHGLLVRHFQWIDFLPVTIRDLDENTKAVQITLWSDIEERAKQDALYQYPLVKEFQGEKLMQLNRFVELFSTSGVSETNITRFLTKPENQFILKMAFFGREIYAEKTCSWAEEEKKPLRPDFFITQPNGYSDIVEFKLPSLKGKPIVGQENRETFSAEVHQYIAQTRVYRDYFDDPRNRSYIEKTYGIRVYYPQRWLVIGRRWMFSTDEWRAIEAEHTDFGIRTYDDMVDGVRAHLYA